MVKNLISLLLLLMVAFSSNAQVNSNKGEVPELQKKIDALKGTYELKAIDARIMTSLPSNLAEIIEKNRKDTEDNSYTLNENTILIIYSKNRVAGLAPVKQ
ncbi:MAG TPA: hypothetical protein VK154_14545 [Chitinophagales bacterium]|nr:hypothetical protein [Chitinophagales bacterium]